MLKHRTVPPATRIEPTRDGVVPVCDVCSYRGKAQPSLARATAALRQHACGNAHRRALRWR